MADYPVVLLVNVTGPTTAWSKPQGLNPPVAIDLFRQRPGGIGTGPRIGSAVTSAADGNCRLRAALSVGDVLTFNVTPLTGRPYTEALLGTITATVAAQGGGTASVGGVTVILPVTVSATQSFTSSGSTYTVTVSTDLISMFG